MSMSARDQPASGESTFFSRCATDHKVLPAPAELAARMSISEYRLDSAQSLPHGLPVTNDLGRGGNPLSQQILACQI